MKNQTTEMITTNGTKEELLIITDGHRQYCSLKPKTTEEKVALFNAVNNPENHLKDFVNIPISVRHVFAEDCEFVNSETGEVSNGVRIVLIGEDGKAYSCASKGVMSSITKIFAIFGDASTWKAPMIMVPKLISKAKDRNVLVVELG